ncbi:hypothetical protein [Streptomyces sp. NPDC050485]|uniref:hypothetical protein n=1 Tax=Streptomyces sp. NPDC050485 TaxID=3365617 RepID=UPI0037B65DE5
MNRSTVRNSVVAVAAALALFPTTAMAATPTAAVAHTHHHDQRMLPQGTVVTPHGRRLHVRAGAGLTYRTTGTLRSGRRVSLVCKKYGTSVRGNSIWYRLATRHVRYISAHYVRVPATPTVPWC